MHVVKIPVYIPDGEFFEETPLHILFTIDKTDHSAQIVDFSYPTQALYEHNPDLDRLIRNAVEKYLTEYFDV